jgi:hypothetical protein
MNDLDRYPFSGHSALLGKVKNDWQQIDYVLNLFGRRKSAARKAYRQFVEKGISLGRRPELVGGGLVRSLGGWEALKAVRKGADKIKGDERILGDNNFVKKALKEAEERLERRYRLKAEGFDFDQVVKRVAQILEIPIEMVWERSRRPTVVEARSLICYWACGELGMRMTELAKRFDLTQPAVSIAVRRGEQIARERKYTLLNG